ncbi:MAG: hypothetical protein PPFGHCPK_01519 (plasmid) [Spiroplasma endosymbiont of Drosophila atripex]|nr:MAG: hypothetical protein PPFGHCPK_01519 [Spiroplasma endosymbiont of Drosophila atripex]
MHCKKCNTALVGPVDYDSLLQRELNHMWICSLCKCCRSRCCTCSNKH